MTPVACFPIPDSPLKGRESRNHSAEDASRNHSRNHSESRNHSPESCFYFAGSTVRGRCARGGESYRPHVPRALDHPVRPRYVPDEDEDEP
jgi:hypothetical protein